MGTIQTRAPFHPLIHYLFVEVALSRIAYFMCMPFVALALKERSDTSATVIGVILGLGPILSTWVGFYVSYLSDHYGRRNILFAAVMLWSLVFFGFSEAKSPTAFGFLMALAGLARGIVDPVTNALLSDLCEHNSALSKKAYQYRYFAINIGGSIGPLLGASLLLKHPALGFQIASGSYFLSAVIFFCLSSLWNVGKVQQTEQKPPSSFRATLKLLGRDHRLRFYISAFFFIGACYCQIESNLSLYLKTLFGKSGIQTYSWMMTCNSALIVLCQFPLLRMLKKLDVSVVCFLGTLFMGIGFGSMGFASTPLHFLLANGVMTLGEIIVFANSYLIIEGLAPLHLKGSYLGAINLSHLGFMIGPAFGGLILENWGGPPLMAFMAGLSLVSGVLYLFGAKSKGLASSS